MPLVDTTVTSIVDLSEPYVHVVTPDASEASVEASVEVPAAILAKKAKKAKKDYELAKALPQEKRNQAIILEYYEKAAKYVGDAAYELAQMYWRGGWLVSKKDFELATKYFERAIELGDSRGAKVLGKIWENGTQRCQRGGITDYQKALFYYKKGADLGCIDCNTTVGLWYILGTHGVEKDIRFGAQYLKKGYFEANKHIIEREIASEQLLTSYGISVPRVI